MRHALAAAVTLVAMALLYLLLWPVPIDPVAWQAPDDRGLVDPFAPNERLRAARGIDLGHHEGPEDATLGVDGRIYATTKDGRVIRMDGENVEALAETGGRPLGIITDRDGTLVVANAILGLQRIDTQGRVTTLATAPANSVAAARDGRLFFSEPSRKFAATDYAGTYEASLLAIMEHGGHGRIWVFDPATGDTTVIADGLTYANGVAISEANDFLLFVETASYRVHKLWLEGPRAGTSEVLLDNLPGFPDNLKAGLGDRFWLGLPAPRNDLLDALSGKPWLRKVIQRLPAALRPKAIPYSHVVAFNGEGEILMNLQDPAARFPTLTGVLETPQSLYLTTLFGHALPVVAKSEL
jgi:sugar lactone lactonase YvrE